MSRIFLNKNKSGRGFFALRVGSTTIGKIDIHITGNELVLSNMIVKDKRYVKSIGRRLSNKMIEYARIHELRIVNPCNFHSKSLYSKLSQIIY